MASYERRGRELAERPEQLKRYRSRLALREQLPLFDTVRYTRDLETALRRMHAARESNCAR